MKLLSKFLSLICFCFLSNFVNAQVFFSENFEGQLNSSTDLPFSWSKKGLSKDKIFQVGDSVSTCVKSNGELLWYVPNHSKFAFTSDISCSYSLGGQNCNKSADRLILPTQDFSSISESILLTFDSYFTGKLGSIASLEYSIDQGVTWVNIVNITPNNNWQKNYFDLSFLNKFSNILICFKFNDNNSLRDGFAVDNVFFYKVKPWVDLKILSSDLIKYSVIPSSQLIPLPLNSYFTNIGPKDAENTEFSLKIYSKQPQKKLLKEYSKSYSIIKKNDTLKVDFGTIFSNELTEEFEFEFMISNKNDTLLLNNSLVFNALISKNEYARDDNQFVSVLGLSNSNTITIGSVFEINRATYIDSISVQLDKKNMALGTNIQAVVYKVKNRVPISDPFGYSSVYTINSNDTISKVILKVTDGFLSRLKLDSGSYLIAINKFINGSSLAIKMSKKYFSEEAVFIKVGDANFQTLDNYFSGSYKLVPSIRMYCSPYCNLKVKINEGKANCLSGVGSLTAIPLNGSYPYKYSWSNNTQDSLLNNVKTGKYGLTYTDKFSCKFDTFGIVLGYDNPPRITVDSISHPKCFGSNDGYVSIKVTDNKKLSKIFWNTLQTNTIYNDQMSEGFYNIKVFNEANCVDSIQIELISPDSIKVTSTLNNETDNEKGDIFLFVSGGVPPYTYFWNDSVLSKNRLQIEGGKDYFVDIKDFNGCVKRKDFQIKKILSIENKTEISKVNVFPNPSTGELYLSGVDQCEVTVENVEGVFISKFNLDSLNRKMDLSEYGKGIYVLRIYGNNTILIRKISII